MCRRPVSGSGIAIGGHAFDRYSPAFELCVPSSLLVENDVPDNKQAASHAPPPHVQLIQMGIAYWRYGLHCGRAGAG